MTGLGVVLAAPAPAAVGPGDAECDVVAGVDQCAQRRHRHVRGAEVRQAGHPLTVGQRRVRDDVVRRPAAGAGVSG